MNTVKVQSRRIPRVALAALLIGVLMMAAFVTPQGRALAQNVLQFFTRAESNSFSVEVITPEPAEALTAIPPSPIITVDDAERLAGFDLAELPSLPDGFNYLGGRMYGNDVNLEYEAQGGGGNLVLMQSKDEFLQSDWDKVPAEAVTPVKIGDMEGEFAQGTFVVMAGESTATWNSSVPIMRLRWTKNGIWYGLTKFGDVEAIQYHDQNGLIALAESLVYEP